MEREIFFASVSLNVFLVIAVIGYRIKCKRILTEFHRILNTKPKQPPPDTIYEHIPKSPTSPNNLNESALAKFEDLEEINPKPRPYNPSKHVRKIGRYDRHW